MEQIKQSTNMLVCLRAIMRNCACAVHKFMREKERRDAIPGITFTPTTLESPVKLPPFPPPSSIFDLISGKTYHMIQCVYCTAQLLFMIILIK